MIKRKPRFNARPVDLNPQEREKLLEICNKGETGARVLKRARILLLLSEDVPPMDVPKAAGAGEATVRRTRQKFEKGGAEYAIAEGSRPGNTPLLTARQRAEIVAMVCADPPEGVARWTIRLIAQEAVARGIVDSVGRETIRVLLRDHELKPWQKKNVVRP